MCARSFLRTIVCKIIGMFYSGLLKQARAASIASDRPGRPACHATPIIVIERRIAGSAPCGPLQPTPRVRRLSLQSAVTVRRPGRERCHWGDGTCRHQINSIWERLRPSGTGHCHNTTDLYMGVGTLEAPPVAYGARFRISFGLISLIRVEMH